MHYVFYLNNATAKHKCSTRGWAMMVQPELVSPSRAQKLVHGSLQAGGKVLKWLFDARYGQHYREVYAKCFFLQTKGGFRAQVLVGIPRSVKGCLGVLISESHDVYYVECFGYSDSFEALWMHEVQRLASTQWMRFGGRSSSNSGV
ncbi:hypothetical protein GOP47_0009015 [Adiantum capillus-veneris]|uniref:Uncharacterized protein n=1 Tax=Adiantum capillus-veneris TaxID=13818 RepID=A0A9D4UZF5_ADICA|nr:hypothetical protein GOP47_0009015 [Adiantum capillus-veneris]